MTYTLPDVADRQALEKRLADNHAKMLAADTRLRAVLDALTARCDTVAAAPGLVAPDRELAHVVRDLIAVLRAEITRDDDEAVA